jgi:hypothetical protein
LRSSSCNRGITPARNASRRSRRNKTTATCTKYIDENRRETNTASDSKEKLNTVKHDAEDTVDEIKHRAQAAGEHLKRGVAGDGMPIGERIVSNVKEVGHKAAADIDAAKRDVRHGAADPDDKV